MQYSPYYLYFLEIWLKRANGFANVMESLIFNDTYILKRMREIYFWFSEQCLLLSVATHMHVCFSNIRKFNFSYYINYCLYVVSVSDVVWVIWKTRVCKTNLFKRRSSLSGRLNLANSALSQVEMSSTFSLIWSQCRVSASRRLPPPLCQNLWMFLGRGMWPVVGWLKRKDCMNCWLESEALCVWDNFRRTRCMRLTSPMPATTLTFALLRSTTSRPASRTQHRIQSMEGRSYGQPTKQKLRGILSTPQKLFKMLWSTHPAMLINLISGSIWVSTMTQRKRHPLKWDSKLLTG